MEHIIAAGIAGFVTVAVPAAILVGIILVLALIVVGYVKWQEWRERS